MHDQRSTARILTLNLLLLLVLGVCCTWWIGRYTDALENTLALFGLSGIFTWAAVVLKFLSDDRLKWIQGGIEHAVLQRTWLTIVLVCGTLGGIAYASTRGAVRLKPSGELVDRTVLIDQNPGGKSSFPLSPSNEVSFRFATVPFRPTRLGIKISGYPKRVIDLHSWELREMAIPDSFLQQLVLLVPTAALIDQRNNALSIQVVAGKQNATAKFSGYMLWLSSEKDLIIPSHVTDGGRSQLEPGQESLARFYTKAERLDEAFELHPGDSVCIAVKAEDGSLQRSQSFTVRDLMNSRDFPQVEVIDVPEPNKTYQGC